MKKLTNFFFKNLGSLLFYLVLAVGAVTATNIVGDELLGQFEDYPTSYVGQAGKHLVVNSGETSVEFVTGGVTGPGSSVDDNIAVFDGTSGVLLKDGGATIASLTNVVTTVFSRVGDIVATAGDYLANLITNTPAGTISSTNVQDAINELDTEKGDIFGPASSTDEAIARYDLTTGKLLQNSGITINDSDVMAGASIDATANTVTNIGLSEFDTDTGDTMKFAIGATLDSADVTVASDGAIITLSAEKSGGGDIRVVFSTGVYIWDTSPADTVTLTAGSDTAPQINYIYMLETSKVLTASTSSFPSATEYMPVATVLAQSAASLQTDGAFKLHAWADHMYSPNSNGHLAHVNSWIRNQPATWQSGAAPTTTITVNGGAIDNVDFANTSGVVLQLHSHAFPALDMGTGEPIFIINDSTTTYDRLADLSSLDTDSTGATLRGNNTYYSVVVIGIVSEAAGDSHILANSPSCFYANATDVVDDPSGCSNYTIPSDFTGTGFIMARINLRYQTSDSGTITEISTEDCNQGECPVSTGGGGGGGGTEFSDNLYRLFSVSDSTAKTAFDLSGITTATTRTLTVQDTDGTIALTDFANTFDKNQTIDLGGLVNSVFNINGSSDSYLRSTAADLFQIGHGGSPVITISSTNDVGIGTDSPTSDLTFADAAHIELDDTPASTDTGSGMVSHHQVDVNSVGITSCLHIDTDGNFVEADADAVTTMPCVALALESGIGSKKVLWNGFITDTGWSWTVGGPLYVSATVGTLTQTAPSGTGDQVQVVGIAISATTVRFSPDLTILEIL